MPFSIFFSPPLYNPHFVNKARSHSQSGVNKRREDVDLDGPLLFIHVRTQQSLDSVIPLLEKAVEVG